MPRHALVLAGADERDLTQLDAYRELGGYAQLERARSMEPKAVLDEILASNLRGRGGAFFATGPKASFIPTEFEILRGALDQTREADLLGGVTLVLHRGAGAYICGEETALLESLEGKR